MCSFYKEVEISHQDSDDHQRSAEHEVMNQKILPELPHDIYKIAQIAERKELELEQLEEVALEYDDKRQERDISSRTFWTAKFQPVLSALAYMA